MVKRRIRLIALLVCLVVLCLPFYANAASTNEAKEPISTEKECALIVSYPEIDFSDVDVKLYKVAGVTSDFQYTLTEPFKESGLILNGIQSQGEWNVIRSTLEAYIMLNDIAADKQAVIKEGSQVSFDRLTPGMYLAVAENTVKENLTYYFESALVPLPYLGMDGKWIYDVSVAAKAQIIPPVDTDEEIELKVLKLWKADENSKSRPESIEVEIFKNREVYKKVILSKENNWAYTWSVKNDGAEWVVAERNVPKGYVMTVERRENAFVLTNTYNSDKPSETPVTGDTSNILLYIIVMNISGILLVILGIIRKRKCDEENK